MDRFPTVDDLAAASLADVLREWQGLGYNRRGPNLWRAAGQIVDGHGATCPPISRRSRRSRASGRTRRARSRRSPSGCRSARSTPTSGACSARIVAGESRALTAREIQALADAVVPPDRAGAWTHALMDLGATTVPRGRRPTARHCPARPWCRFAAGIGDRSRRPARVAARRAEPRSPRPRAGSAAGSSIGSRGPGRQPGSRSTAPIGDHDAHAVARALERAWRSTGWSTSTARRPRRAGSGGRGSEWPDHSFGYASSAMPTTVEPAPRAAGQRPDDLRTRPPRAAAPGRRRPPCRRSPPRR